MMFQIDYLVNKDEFSQLTLYTNQAVLLSLFLQSIAAEILRDLGRTVSFTSYSLTSIETKRLNV
jgi:hypothetical protein